MMPMTKLEKQLVTALAEMVFQHMPESDERPGIYNSGFISANKTAMVCLVDLGIMEELYPPDRTRWYSARFIEDWRWRLRAAPFIDIDDREEVDR